MSWDREGVLAGRYRNLGRIGQGGMGAVWRAHDADLDREVAIKELRVPEQVTEQERAVWYARMEREARAAARLRHPAIVTVYDRVMGEDGRPWIVMELIQGRSLERLLAERGRLSARQVAGIGLAMLDALSAAHAQGVVHRDVKPANVLLEGERVVLTDFGIAAVEGDATLTRSGAVLGTPAYMSPEQVRGETTTPASDLWSLGATLYAAVEGRPPFTAPTHGALFIAIATREPPPPACGGPLALLLTGLLRKDPAARPSPAHARELLAAAADGGEPPPAPARPSAPGPARDRARPVAVRGALACAWTAVAGTLLLPFEIGDGMGGKVVLEEGPYWLMGLLVVLIALSAWLWTLPHRPVPALACVVVVDLAALLAAPVGRLPIASQYVLFSGTAEVGYGTAFAWLAGAAALMLAFTAVNGPPAAGTPSRRPLGALLGPVVVLEGLAAVLWPVLAFGAMGKSINLAPLTVDFVDTWMLVAALALMGLAWTTAHIVLHARRV
ncbi:serine/threonine-protein kinase [Actinomadura sp. NAK00032]|uniref:serine/threonine-protein kinase n=1 Tax=Actinomadura sp. NAK00032 TaxID=2742128 RepID=UPI0020C7BB12|nr:serine/threonine-protein kinase [Actinomadura sp. NAK00032]